ncbi:shikimate dehydrogenase [Gordonia effusa NBRC 100432]|uniref:Shikimate dehydrogenase n=1 Tax=Gordonia effusa NBRC 100432 TaxID=1077974 RepID=H0QZJ4_9ACTN|nr:shikimate dehydrogenase [Gordonia effusa]GAB18245.1 shikimate dehydrogenase [Gordonia effusa NBRC 100432]
MRAAVLGKPISHSRSPDLHLAAYAALGLVGWTYERLECDADSLPALVDGLDDSYVGLSVTMPGKFAALRYATEVSDRAALVGSANTLVRTERGWYADCTDIDGMTGALTEIGADFAVRPRAVVIGAGGTAMPTLAALGTAGVRHLTVVARDRDRALRTFEVADELGMAVDYLPFEASPALTDAAVDAAVTISTVPAAASATIAAAIAPAERVIDVIYAPWPTPLADAVTAAGGIVVGGLVMLLNQAYRQVELFTGLPAPKAAMAAALDDSR